MRVSIALCTYNGQFYLEEQLRSLLRQTRPVDEIIVCDDGSVDETIWLIQQLSESYQGLFKIQRNENRLGARLNFEKAASLCTGEIIFFCDQDDQWHPDKIERTIQAFESDPGAMAVFCNGNLMEADGVDLKETMWDNLGFSGKIRQQVTKDNLLEYLLINGNVVSGATLAFRKEMLGQILPFFLPGDTWHDYWVAIMLSAARKLLLLDEVLMNYRVHADQLVGFDLTTKEKAIIPATPILWPQAVNEFTDIDGLQTMKIVHAISRYRLFEKTLLARYPGCRNDLELLGKRLKSYLAKTKLSWLRSSMPMIPRKVKLLKHWLKGGEHLQISIKDLFTI